MSQSGIGVPAGRLLRPLGWSIVLAACVALVPHGQSGVPAQGPPQSGRASGPPAPAGPRLKAMIVSGGCCHDYALQDKILMDVMARTLPIDWTVVVQGGTGTNAKIPLYENPDWAKGFDIVVHNECYADVNDETFIKRITDAHRAGSIPAMVIHCSMHSYRAATGDLWREFLGVTSRRHTRAHNVAVKFTAKDHAIMKDLQDTWTTPVDELYVIEKLWPGAQALATAVSPEPDHSEYPVMWAHEYAGARVFGTTLGHGNDTWNDPVFQDVLRRAFMWTTKKIG